MHNFAQCKRERTWFWRTESSVRLKNRVQGGQWKEIRLEIGRDQITKDPVGHELCSYRSSSLRPLGSIFIYRKLLGRSLDPLGSIP